MRGVVLYTGGLGNQLFQFAFMLYLNKKLGIVPKYNCSFYDMYNVHSGFEADKIFDFCGFDQDCHKLYGRYVIYSGVKRRTGIRLGHMFCEEEHFCEDKVFPVYKGYWQDVKFYNAVKTELMDRLKCLDGYADPVLLERICATNSVMVHIRRGDYCGNSKYFDLSTSNYYARAMQKMKETVQQPRFFVFSDDVAWCKKFFSGENDYEYVEYPNQTTIGDLALMTKCKNAVIANSSFSWWGAALGNKEKVIYPLSYYTNASAGNLYPDNWEGVVCQPID